MTTENHLSGDGGVNQARQQLLDTLRQHALIIGEVTLTSGRTAQYYVDCKRAILLPAGFRARQARVHLLSGSR